VKGNPNERKPHIRSIVSKQGNWSIPAKPKQTTKAKASRKDGQLYAIQLRADSKASTPSNENPWLYDLPWSETLNEKEPPMD
jgi:hypothetical protein